MTGSGHALQHCESQTKTKRKRSVTAHTGSVIVTLQCIFGSNTVVLQFFWNKPLDTMSQPVSRAKAIATISYKVSKRQVLGAVGHDFDDFFFFSYLNPLHPKSVSIFHTFTNEQHIHTSDFEHVLIFPSGMMGFQHVETGCNSSEKNRTIPPSTSSFGCP